MMNKLIVYVADRQHFYDLENLIEVFVLKSQLEFVEDMTAYHEKMTDGDNGLQLIYETAESVTFVLNHKGTEKKVNIYADKAHFKRNMKRALYELLAQYYEPMSKWGILVGIRPVKIVHELMDKGMTEPEIREILLNDYLIQPEKVNLLLEIATRERPHLFPVEKDKISVYICIPFCPTRCLYCSFPSNSLEKKKRLVPEYLSLLIREIEETFALIHSKNQVIDCIYIGGGTPTSLDHQQLEALLKTITGHTDMTLVKEFTVEAGRPDTIDLVKLTLMKQHGVSRVCINPQTMNDETLVKIGRNHSADDIFEVMQLVRQVGFHSVNMDLIMGLPGETLTHAEKTLTDCLLMKPDNVTVHTLAVKRASRLNENYEQYELTHDQTVEDMMTLADTKLRTSELIPYYMYRQKKMIGHLENVGYALKTYESLYNMRIMEERHTIIALGAGAVSKICYPDENRFERVANFKGVEDYISRFDEVLKRKHFIE